MNRKASRGTESCLTFTRLSPSVCPSIWPVSWTKRRWPGQNPGPVRGPLCLSVCQRLGSGSQPGFGSGPGPACLIEAPGGGKRGHPPTSWSQKQKVLFIRLILRRPNLWVVDMNSVCERRRKKKEGGKYWNFTLVNLLFIWCIVRADQDCDEAHGFKKDPWLKGHESCCLGTTLPQTETQKTWRTKADHVKDLCTVLTGREGMNNVIIKRRQDWQ